MGDATVVLYHADCQDGFGAAYAAWKALGDRALYLPVRYQEPPPPELSLGVEALYILDFSYPRPVLERLRAAARTFAVLDHHETAREALDGLPGAIYDEEKSGAVLAWEYFHPDWPVPLLLRYVQDRDLWRWEMESSRAFSARLAEVPRDFTAWDEIRDFDTVDQFCCFIAEGGLLLAAQARRVDMLCRHAFSADVGGHRVPVVNAPIHQSEIGEELLRRHPDAPFAGVFAVGESEEFWSLRSRGDCDVSEIARGLGGGGHRAAAGFKRPRM